LVVIILRDLFLYFNTSGGKWDLTWDFMNARRTSEPEHNPAQVRHNMDFES